MRNRAIGCGVAVLIALAGAVTAQEPTFAGKWKLNVAKSQLSGQTVTFQKKSDDLITFDSQGFKYDFSLDGKEHPMPDGGTTAWKQVSPTMWAGTNRANGKVIATIDSVLNGDSLSFVVKAHKADGTMSEMTSNWKRVTGGPGFLGTWKSTGIKGAALSLELSVQGTNGITMKTPELQMACTGSFDGKDYPVMMGGAAMKQTFAFERQGAKAFKMITKLDGKPFSTDVFTLSADGKTLTDDGMPVAANEPSKAVYERQ
jgi:hypothetical protein